MNGNSKVYGNAVIGNSFISENAEIYGTAIVRGGSKIIGHGKVNCGRWSGVTVTDDQTGKCGRNGQTESSGLTSLTDVLSNPISKGNTESN
ncbi:MAG: hypothetical protein OXC62_15760 [Aestuariivita sp.]|nr:hypothetical protein [Aestuariivita sp.]